MRKLKKIFKSTLAKVISALIILCFLLSGFLFFDFYKRQLHKAKGFYWVYRGDEAFKQRDLQNAIYYYEKGIKYHPNHYKALYNLANIYVVYEDYYQALKNYEKALSIRPDYEVARIDYAIILSQTYRTDEAIQQYEKVLKNPPKFVKIPFIIDNKKTYTYNRGVAYYNMGLAYRTKSLIAGLDSTESNYYLKKASESYKEALNVLKTYNANYNLGLINQLLKNRNQAGYYYCRAIEIEPMEYEAHFNLAVLLNDMKDFKGASEEFKRASLLLGSGSNPAKIEYIYNVLADVNQKIAINKDENYFKKIKEEDEKFLPNYKAGKIVIEQDEQKENQLRNEFSKCIGYDIFVGEND